MSQRALRLDARDRQEVSPKPEWFVWRKDASKPWYQRLVSFPFCPPPPGWTVAQTALYFCLLCNNMNTGLRIRHDQKRAGLGAVLGISRPTVHRALKKLESLGLVECEYLRPPSKEVLALFADKPKKDQKRNWQASVALGWPFGTEKDGPNCARLIDLAARKMLRANYSHREVINYFNDVSRAARCKPDTIYDFMLRGFDECFRDAEESTLRSRADGRFNGRNSAGIMKMKSEQCVKSISANPMV